MTQFWNVLWSNKSPLHSNNVQTIFFFFFQLIFLRFSLTFFSFWILCWDGNFWCGWVLHVTSTVWLKHVYTLPLAYTHTTNQPVGRMRFAYMWTVIGVDRWIDTLVCVSTFVCTLYGVVWWFACVYAPSERERERERRRPLEANRLTFCVCEKQTIILGFTANIVSSRVITAWMRAYTVSIRITHWNRTMDTSVFVSFYQVNLTMRSFGRTVVRFDFKHTCFRGNSFGNVNSTFTRRLSLYLFCRW